VLRFVEFLFPTRSVALSYLLAEVPAFFSATRISRGEHEAPTTVLALPSSKPNLHSHDILLHP
jgi:hypothetical protein